MKTPIAFVSGFALCALLFASLGAGPGNQYDRACLAVCAENVVSGYVAQDAKRRAACDERFEYWVRIMEQFKP